jgi:hypothetical protein
MENIDIQALVENARMDPSLLSKINITELLSSQIKSEYLENKTHQDIAEDIFESLNDLGWISHDCMQTICNSLLEYRYVDEIYKLHLGKPIKWLKINPPDSQNTKLKSGGICTGIRFGDNGTYISCLALNGRNYFQIKYDDHLIYQKLNYDEQLLLLAYEYANK